MYQIFKLRGVGALAIGLGIMLLTGAGCGNRAATTGVSKPGATAPAGAVAIDTSSPAAVPQPAKRPSSGATAPKLVETTTQGETAKLPAEFPSSFPIMPGAKLNRTYSVVGGKVLALEVEFTLGKPVADAIAFYQNALPGSGWTVGGVSAYVGAQVMPVSSGAWSGHLTFGSNALPFVKVELNFKK